MEPIFGFYHICTINRWQSIVESQVKIIAESGLYDKTKQIFVTITGPNHQDVVLPDKYKIVHQAEDKTKFERLALNYMLNFCKSLVLPAKIWYIHSKGVKFDLSDTVQYNPVLAWRQYMEYFVIEQHSRCIEALTTHNACGVNLRGWPSMHFSGNFWWANSDYIKTLKPLSLEDETNPTSQKQWMLDWYLSPELWIGSNATQQTMFSLFDSGSVNLYKQIFPREKYVYKNN